MATRHQSRFASISLLYAHEMGTYSDDFMAEFLDEQKIRNEQRNFTTSLFEGVLANQINIDNKLNSLLSKWKLAQIGSIERAILRLGAYEIMFASTDAKIVISEAVALANEFGSESATKLVNALLDKIAKDPHILSEDEVAQLKLEDKIALAEQNNIKSGEESLQEPKKEFKERPHRAKTTSKEAKGFKKASSKDSKSFKNTDSKDASSYKKSSSKDFKAFKKADSKDTKSYKKTSDKSDFKKGAKPSNKTTRTSAKTSAPKSGTKRAPKEQK